MVHMVNKLPVIKLLFSKSLKIVVFVNMIEITNMRQMLNILFKCILTALVLSYAQIKPLKVSKYALFYSSIMIF